MKRLMILLSVVMIVTNLLCVDTTVYGKEVVGDKIEGQKHTKKVSDNGRISTELKNPQIIEGNGIEEIQKVTWDCIWFGSYPQAEVIPLAENYEALSPALVKEDALIVDDNLYNMLQREKGWDRNGDVMIDGNMYRRITKDDATSVFDFSMGGGSGNYKWKDSDNYHYFKYEPIKWRVLQINKTHMFIVSDIALDNQEFDIYRNSTTWEVSVIRNWLNGYDITYDADKAINKNFLDSAFNTQEKLAIENTSVVNKKNSEYNTDSGNDTVDKVFLLAESEVCGDMAKTCGLGLGGCLGCKSSTYAKAMGTSSETRGTFISCLGNCDWWLRSSGSNTQNTQLVSALAHVDKKGITMTANSSVRPALNLNISSDQWSYAGTVCSDGTVNGEDSSEKDKDSEIMDEEKYKDNIRNIMPDMKNLGSATLNGPEITILGNKFNLFETDMKISLPFLNKQEVNIKLNRNDNTAELLFGVQGKKIETKDNDAQWTETYKEVKSLVESCYKDVDTNKLWNKFSKLRGKLKAVDEKAVFKAKGNVAGYMKIQMDEKGYPQKIIESGIAGGFEAGANVKRAKIWWIVYSDFGIAGSINGTWYANMRDMDTMTYGGEVKLAVKPTVALGADAVVVDIKGGINGEIAGKVTFPWEKFDKSVNAYLTAEIFVKVETPIPGLLSKNDKDKKGKIEKSYKLNKLELYPDLGKITERGSVLQYTEPKPASKQMIKMMTAASEDAVDTIEGSLVYENAKPEMIKLPDGKILMVYLADMAGETKLMYRVYDDNQWSASKPVWEEGGLNTAGHLYQYNDSLYVIYESSNQKITEDMSAEEIAGLMDLYVARYSEESFEKPIKLGKSGTWKYAYQLVEHEGSLRAIWAENSANDVLLESGNTIIYESEFTDTWQNPIEISYMDQVMTEVVSGTVGNTFITAYIKDDQIYIGNESLDISDVGEHADSLRIQDGKLYVRIDGVLCYYDGEDIRPQNVECTTSYQIQGNMVYWIQQNNFKSEIISKQMNMETAPIAVTCEDGYVGGFTVVQDEQGKPVISYTYQTVDEATEGNPYGATILKFKEDITRYQAEIVNVAYDILSFNSGEENLVVVTVCNTGTDTLNQLVLTISDGSKTLYKGNIANSLQVGESKECEIPVLIPEGFLKEKLKFSLSADESFKKEVAQEYEMEYCNTDIEVTENTVDEIIVKNNSDEVAKGVMVLLHNQDRNGDEIRKISIGDLKASEEKAVSVKKDWENTVKDALTGKKYLYCEVIQVADEYELWNNNIVLEKQESNSINDNENINNAVSVIPNISHISVSKISISGISKKIAAGKKIKLTATVTPSNAANKSIKWKSSNKKVAKVNSSGVVTMNKKSGGKSVTITATAADGSGVKASYKIKSMKGVVKKVTISGKKTVKAGKTLKLKAKVTATKKANKKLKWTSSNKKYATVSSSGKVKALKAGKGKKVKITAMATDGSGKKKTVTIKIK